MHLLSFDITIMANVFLSTFLIIFLATQRHMIAGLTIGAVRR